MMGQDAHRAGLKTLLRAVLYELWFVHADDGLDAIDEVMDEFANRVEAAQDAPLQVIRGGKEV